MLGTIVKLMVSYYFSFPLLNPFPKLFIPMWIGSCNVNVSHIPSCLHFFNKKELFICLKYLLSINNLPKLSNIVNIGYFTMLNFYNLIWSRIIVTADAVEKERSRRLTTAILNQEVREAVAFKSPPRTRGGKRGRVYYCTQVLILT